MLPADLSIFEQTISKARLNSYRSYFNADLREAVGLYMWNAEVSSCVRVLLSYFEIALRNSIHRELSLYHCHALSAAWYLAMMPHFNPETRRQIQKLTHLKNGAVRNPAPAPDSVVANLSFGCWLPIMKAIHLDRHSLFPRIFPGHPLNATPNDWRQNTARNRGLRFIEELNVARNRIGHHEPLWKFSAINDTSSTGRAVSIAAASTNQAESLARFRRLLGLFDDGLAWVNQSLATDLRNSSWRAELEFLLTDRGLTRYRKTRHIPKPVQISPAVFRRDFGLVCRADQPVRLAGGKGAASTTHRLTRP